MAQQMLHINSGFNRGYAWCGRFLDEEAVLETRTDLATSRDLFRVARDHTSAYICTTCDHSVRLHDGEVQEPLSFEEMHPDWELANGADEFIAEMTHPTVFEAAS